MSDDTSLGADLAAAMGGSTSTPAEPSGSVSTADTSAATGAATTEPAQGAAVTSTPDPTGADPAKTGPIPFDVHKTALDNARTKAVAEYQQKYGWAEGIQQQEFQQMQQVARHLYGGGNPVEGLQTLIAEMRKDPAIEAQIRSFAAKTLAQRSQTPQAEQEPQPDVPIQLEDGRVIHMYSGEQQARRDAFLQKQWMQSVEQKLQPLQQTHEQLQAQRQAYERAQQIDHYVTSTSQDVKTWPHMDKAENLAQLQQELAKFPDTDDPREVSLQLDRAYRTVMARTILPSLQATERKALLTDHTLKAHATTASPNHASAAAPQSYADMSWQDAFRSELAARR